MRCKKAARSLHSWDHGAVRETNINLKLYKFINGSQDPLCPSFCIFEAGIREYLFHEVMAKMK